MRERSDPKVLPSPGPARSNKYDVAAHAILLRRGFERVNRDMLIFMSLNQKKSTYNYEL